MNQPHIFWANRVGISPVSRQVFPKVMSGFLTIKPGEILIFYNLKGGTKTC